MHVGGLIWRMNGRHAIILPIHRGPDVDIFQIQTGRYGGQRVVEITADEHADHRMARHCLIDAGNFERRFELLLGNFLAWEEFCAVSQLRFELIKDIGYEQGDILIMEANRHIINVFTSGKTYIDQVKQDFKFLGEDGAFSKHAVALTKAAYDRSLFYRLTYELRNRSQHRALVVDGMNAGSPKDGKETIAFHCFKAKIAEDGKFKKSVLEEAPEKIDLHAMLRGYMTEVSGIHIALRAKVRQEVDRSRALFAASIKRYAAAQQDPKDVSKDGVGVEAIHIRDDTVVEAVPLILKWDNTRKKLAEKNRYPIK